MVQVRRLDWIWDKRYDVLIDKAGIRFAQSLRSVAGVGIGQREREPDHAPLIRIHLLCTTTGTKRDLAVAGGWALSIVTVYVRLVI